MAKITRKEFLGSGATLAAALGLGSLPGCSPGGEAAESSAGAPDLIVVNGRVFTMDDAQPRAQAFAVKNGRFVAVGSDDDVRNLAGRGTRIVDVEGMTVTPGFIDTHTHADGTGDLFGVSLDLRSIDEIKQALRKAAAETPAGHWVEGRKYDDTKVREGRRITRWDLDEAVPDHPVSVSHRGGHIAWYNSKAFEMAGITKDVQDPPGGRFERNAEGELTGLVEERARSAFNGVGIRRELSRQDRQAGVAFISKEMAKSGLTSVQQTGGGTDSLIALQDAYGAGELSFRMYLFPSGGSELFSGLKAAGARTGFGDEWVRIGGVKYGADGSASGRTMRMNEPYVGRPDDYGILTMTQEQIDEAVDDAHAHDFQIGIHANGDYTIDLVLNAYERIKAQQPDRDHRFRIEHCSLVNPQILNRIAAVGAIPTPFWTYVYYHGDKWAAYGEERMQWMFAHRSFLDHGIPVPGASDYTPGPYQPMMALQSLVTRTDWQGKTWGPNQRVSVDEALRIGTINGAYASFEEDLKGSITAGKLADFVVLGQDPHEVDPFQIINIPVVRTVVGGRTVHEV